MNRAREVTVSEMKGPKVDKMSSTFAGAVRRSLRLIVLSIVLLSAWVWAQGGSSPPGSAMESTEPETPELETFVPSENVAADQSVAFPVDI